MDAKGRTNHYLFYAQTLIKEILSPDKGREHLMTQALLSSVCLQLQQCWCAWLVELGQITKTDIRVDTFTGQAGLAQSTGEKTVLSPEMLFIHENANTKGTWLNALRLLYEDPIDWLNSYKHELKGAEAGTSSLSISIVNLDAEEQVPVETRLQTIVNELKTYIHNVREQQTEW